MPQALPARILLVEDDADARDMYAMGFRAAGFEVIEASSAEEAIEQLGRSVPAVIVSDIALPGEDGFELCQRIRRLEAHQTTPIIGITAISVVQAMVQAKRAGFTEVITKPCSPADLVAAVQQALNPPEPFPKPKPIKAEEKRHTPSERAWRIRARRFGSGERAGGGSGEGD